MSLFIYFDLPFRLTKQIAKRPSVDAISAELEVLKTKHASLENFLEESSEKETKAKRELGEKHAKAMSELAEKLKTSNQRVKTLVSKAKAYEAEASDIDELIFRKHFRFPACPLHSFFPISETDHAIVCLYQHVSDSNGQMTPAFPELKLMKKPRTPSMISSSLTVALPRRCP
jgi:seryl-tRNA synthetase